MKKVIFLLVIILFSCSLIYALSLDDITKNEGNIFDGIKNFFRNFFGSSTSIPTKIPRLGVGVHSHSPADYIDWYDYENLGAGWFFTWGYGAGHDGRGVIVPEGMEFFPMLYSGRCSNNFKNYVNSHLEIYPNGTTFMIGNEFGYPINNIDSYVEDYHNCYEMLKNINPTYKLATAALQYYDEGVKFTDFREKYNAKYGSYPDIGAYRMNVYSGYNSLKAWVPRLRTKMKEWGDQDKDLIITESCVRDGGTFQNNVEYLNEAFDYVTTSSNLYTGNPNDDYKLVQRFAWFCLNGGYPGCSLFNPSLHGPGNYPPLKDELTPVGEAFVDWVESHPPPTIPGTTTTITGGIKLKTLFPNWTGLYSQWEGVGCYPNWNCVRRSDFEVTESVDGQRDLYNLDNTGLTSEYIIDTLKVCVGGRSPAGWGSAYLSVYTHSTLYDAASKDSFGGGWVTKCRSWNKNPYTGQKWTPSELDAMQAGIKKSGSGEVVINKLFVDITYHLGATTPSINYLKAWDWNVGREKGQLTTGECMYRGDKVRFYMKSNDDNTEDKDMRYGSPTCPNGNPRIWAGTDQSSSNGWEYFSGKVNTFSSSRQYWYYDWTIPNDAPIGTVYYYTWKTCNEQCFCVSGWQTDGTFNICSISTTTTTSTSTSTSTISIPTTTTFSTTTTLPTTTIVSTTTIPTEFTVTNFDCNSVSEGFYECFIEYPTTSSKKIVMFLMTDTDGKVWKSGLGNINIGSTQTPITFCCDTLTGAHKISYWVYDDSSMSNLITWSTSGQKKDMECG